MDQTGWSIPPPRIPGQMKRQHLTALALADALLAGDPTPDAFVARAASCMGRRHRWIAPLCKRTFQRFGSTRPDRTKLAEWIKADAGYQRAWTVQRAPMVRRYFMEPPRMAPRPGALAACALPSLATPGELAAWLGLEAGELDWFANAAGRNDAIAGPLCHYTYRWIAKRRGMRLMEAPKARLRALQRRILREILDPVPAHAAAHGFRRGRSCQTYARPHIGRLVVLRMDLRDFFPRIPAARVHALFETLGYPEAVARLLTGLCTNRVPMSVARHDNLGWAASKWYGVPHLPQGAPTSPALANLSALRLDLRLAALAATLGAEYTRYADDLAFSGGESLRRRVGRVALNIAAIALEEGFEVNHRKTLAMHRSGRQKLAGIVVNERPNIMRADFDRLKATLTNCVRHGPSSQNRGSKLGYRAHLTGRVAHVENLNKNRGSKLRALLARIDWDQ